MDSSDLTHSTAKTPASLKNDFLASIVVFLVALPLCMGIAIASGAPVAAGLITGIVGGLIVGTLAGAPLQVSGPAAGLTVIVYEIVRQHGLPVLGLVVLLAGALQLTAGLFRLGQWFRAVSPAVIQGMLAGIGVLIFASQFHVMVDDAPKGSGLQNLVSIPAAIQKGLPWPEFRSREEREFRTAKLQEIGRLHQQQASIQERIDETIPQELDPSQFAAMTDVLAPYETQQAAISSELTDLIADLDGWLKAEPHAHLTRLHEAASAALIKSQAARDSLLLHDLEHVRQSQQEATAALEELSAGLKNHDWAAKVGLLTIAVIVLWQSFAPKRVKLLPGALIAVLLATGVAVSLSLPVLYVEVPDSLLDGVRWPSLTVLSEVSWAALIQSALVIAVVASAETLLCATAVDQMHNGPRTRYDRELCAQGFGNMICGFLGALPMTGVIVRSATNVHAGARSRLSAILHGVWLLVFVVGLGWMLRMIPTASLAGILVYTGYKLVNPKSIRELWAYGKGEVFVYAMTVAFIVATDLLTGVLVGIGLSAVKLLLTFARLKVRLELSDGGERGILRLDGAATFLRLPRLAAELERVPAGCRLRIDTERLTFLDHACLNLLKNWARQHESHGGTVDLDWDALPIKGRRSGGRQQPAPRTAQPDTGEFHATQTAAS